MKSATARKSKGSAGARNPGAPWAKSSRRRASGPIAEGGDHVPSPGFESPTERRRASRLLWSAIETLLSASEPRSLNRALDSLTAALGGDGVALHALGPSGGMEPWCARGAWHTRVGDLRDCVVVPLFRGAERVGTLELMGRSGAPWHAAQLSLIRTAAGALGAALGARLELERLRNQPGRDAITGLPDARAFHVRLTQELARARRHGFALAVISLDVDHFAALNSRYGRPTGDEVLAEMAFMIKLTLRESDVLSRLGGDGFAALLPETDVSAALRCADRIRRALEDHRFARAGKISISAGVAASPRDGLEAVELLSRADHALSIAKKSGRRRVVASDHAYAH